MEADGSNNYIITITADDKPEDGTESPIILTILGNKSSSQKKVVSELGIKPGKTKSASVYDRDVGGITGFKIELENNGRLKPTEVIIENLSNNSI
jgi:hypothetical protein